MKPDSQYVKGMAGWRPWRGPAPKCLAAAQKIHQYGQQAPQRGGPVMPLLYDATEVVTRGPSPCWQVGQDLWEELYLFPASSSAGALTLRGQGPR